MKFKIGGLNHVTLKVFNVLGREMATLVNENEPAGDYIVSWDASNCSSGVYFYRLMANAIPPGRAGSFLAVKMMILLK